MPRIVLVVPERVEWTGQISCAFTAQVKERWGELEGDMPQAYGFLKRESNGWNLMVIENGTLLYDGQSWDRHAMVGYLQSQVKRDIVLLMDKADDEAFRALIQPYIPQKVVRPNCGASVIRS